MLPILAHVAAAPSGATQVFLLPPGTTALPEAAVSDLSAAARAYAETALAHDQKLVPLNHFSHQHYYVVLADKPTAAQVLEALRRSGHQLHGLLKAERVTEVFIQKPGRRARRGPGPGRGPGPHGLPIRRLQDRREIAPGPGLDHG